ncbi:MAG: esterase [Proteobacteria bacterium]|mgnify:FL=1|nr:esterase [Pseudomonadota bacterium]HOL37064.1 alpha/beta hydrolase-fold protein [Rubrivivax sp.]
MSGVSGLSGVSGVSGLPAVAGRVGVVPPFALPIEWLPAAGAPEQLIVLLHGWRCEATDMAPLARAVRAALPQAAVLVPDAPHAADTYNGRTRGRQWYSRVGLEFVYGTDLPWHRRVGAARVPVQDWLRAQQQRLGVAPAATVLAGFSQGAIVALEIALREDDVAGCVLAFAGCLTAPPPAAPRRATLHLLQGAADEVVPMAMARATFDALAAPGGDVTLDVADGVGHEVHPALIECALRRLIGRFGGQSGGGFGGRLADPSPPRTACAAPPAVATGAGSG